MMLLFHFFLKGACGMGMYCFDYSKNPNARPWRAAYGTGTSTEIAIEELDKKGYSTHAKTTRVFPR